MQTSPRFPRPSFPPRDMQDATSAHTGTPGSPSGLGLSVRPRKEKQKRSTGPSRVVPHRSTTPARTSLTSLFGWEAVSLVDMAALKKQSMFVNTNDTHHRPHVLKMIETS